MVVLVVVVVVDVEIEDEDDVSVFVFWEASVLNRLDSVELIERRHFSVMVLQVRGGLYNLNIP